MLVSELLSASLRKIGALSSGETIETVRQSEALSALQSMLRSWGVVSNAIYASINESITLTPGKVSYTWGSGGDITTTRPNQIIGAYITDFDGMTHAVDVISQTRYSNITYKDTVNRPYALYYYPAFPLATVYLYPVPDAAEYLSVNSYKPFVETGSFGLTTNTIVFPGYYEEPLIYNLAIRLAPEYGKTVLPDVTIIAERSLRDLTTLHAANRVEPMYIAIPAGNGYGARYSINSDSYR